jgi:hypothetical protein
MKASSAGKICRVAVMLTCTAAAAGCPPGVPVADVCDTPNSAGVESVELGRASLDSAFIAWDDGEEIEIVFGGQGDTMVALRYRVRGSGLDCIRQQTILRDQEGSAITEDRRALRVYREAQGVYLTETHWVVIPYFATPATGALLEIEAEVGSAVASVELRAAAQ